MGEVYLRREEDFAPDVHTLPAPRLEWNGLDWIVLLEDGRGVVGMLYGE